MRVCAEDIITNNLWIEMTQNMCTSLLVPVQVESTTYSIIIQYKELKYLLIVGIIDYIIVFRIGVQLSVDEL